MILRENKEELVTEISKSAKVTKKEAEAVLSATIIDTQLNFAKSLIEKEN